MIKEYEMINLLGASQQTSGYASGEGSSVGLLEILRCNFLEIKKY